MTWKIVREAAINLGGARAVLMQLAHPLIAAGVSTHSSYMTDPYGRAMRTFLLGQMITFGSPDLARQAARTINRLHTHVHGSLSIAAGAFESGTAYKAQDPELLLWVHASLIDTILLVYPLVIGPLTRGEQEQYYQESKRIARLVGLQEKNMPKTVHDLRHYVDEMVHSPRLAATPQTRQLVHQVLFPPAPTLARPLMHLHLGATTALLPQPIRDIYGLEWSNQQQRLFDWSMRSMKAVIPHLPLSLRVFPITRQLMRGEDFEWEPGSGRDSHKGQMS